MSKIDELDIKLLNELMEDASISVPKLSKKINVNASVIYSRIKRLIRLGFIKKFTVVINEEALGFNVKALSGVNIDAKKRENILKELKEIPEIEEIIEVTGRFDIIIRLYARTLDEIYTTMSERIGKIDGVNKTETFIEMKCMPKGYRLTLPKMSVMA